MSNSNYSSIFERARAYPFVTPDTFAQSRRICCETGSVEPVTTPVDISVSPFAACLPGSPLPLPAYNLIFADGAHFADRIAVIAIGSNSSSDVMMKKLLASPKGGGRLFIAQAEIEHHAIVHGAFLGAAGTVPATLTPEAQSTSRITISFLTQPQAEILTMAEPNYDLVLIDSILKTVGLPNSPVIRRGALVYVSPWGLLSEDGHSPLAQAAIPAQTPLKKMTSEEAMSLLARKVCPFLPVEKYFNQLSGSILSRLLTNTHLQMDALPSHITGRQVLPSLMAGEALAHGVPIPRLCYRTP